MKNECNCPHCAGCHEEKKGDEKRERIVLLVRVLVLAALWVAAALVRVRWMKIAAFSLALAEIGWDVAWGAAKGIAKGKLFDERFLMTVAAVAAAAIGEFHEALAVMLLYQVGEALQDWSSDKTRENVAKLMDLAADEAVLVEDGGRRTVRAEEVPVGALVEVRPGAKVPLDGLVEQGESDLAVAALTGESRPRAVAPGSEALSGSVNGGGLLLVRTTKPYAESTVGKILALVEEASEKKAKAEKFITRFARVYTPVVCAAALLLAFLPLAFGQPLRVWGYRALIFLVSSCPCALVISVPLAYFAGIGRCAAEGVLVKGGNHLDALAAAKAVVLDKTGTLTSGTFSVIGVYPADGVTEAELARAAAQAEAHSDHPLARAIADYFMTHSAADTAENADTGAENAEVEELPGRGVRAKIGGRTLLAGNVRLMEEEGIAGAAESERTAVHVAADGKYLGRVELGDALKEGSRSAIERLRGLGVGRTVLLTGDARAAAEAAAREAGIGEVRAELLPQDKVELLGKIRAESGVTAFVGDGVNDAPALALADVGVAMGGLGSDAAIEAADAVILDDDLQKLPTAIGTARKAREIVRENVTVSVGVKLAVMALGAAGIASMWWAVFADVGICLAAVANCLRLGVRRRKKR